MSSQAIYSNVDVISESSVVFDHGDISKKHQLSLFDFNKAERLKEDDLSESQRVVVRATG